MPFPERGLDENFFSAGVSGFGERLSRLNLLAIPLAVIAIGLIAAGIG